MKLFVASLVILFSQPSWAAMQDDPLLIGGEFERFSVYEGDAQHVEVDLWFGRSLSRWQLETELEMDTGQTSAYQIDLMHSRAISAHWNFNLGASKQSHDGHKSHWLTLGFNGLAPYFLETDLSLYLRENTWIASAEIEHELPLTTDWIIHSRFELDAANRDDPTLDVYKGLSDVELSVFLVYERTKQLHPYLEISHHRKFGSSADASSTSRETRWAVGLKAWF